jgi:hypothetical protein
MGAALTAIERDHGLIRMLSAMPTSITLERTRSTCRPDQFDGRISVNVRVPHFASQWVAERLIAAVPPVRLSTPRRSPARRHEFVRRPAVDARLREGLQPERQCRLACGQP